MTGRKEIDPGTKSENIELECAIDALLDATMGKVGKISHESAVILPEIDGGAVYAPSFDKGAFALAVNAMLSTRRA